MTRGHGVACHACWLVRLVARKLVPAATRRSLVAARCDLLSRRLCIAAVLGLAAVLGTACGLDNVGPDLDAYAAAQAAAKKADAPQASVDTDAGSQIDEPEHEPLPDASEVAHEAVAEETADHDISAPDEVTEETSDGAVVIDVVTVQPCKNVDECIKPNPCMTRQCKDGQCIFAPMICPDADECSPGMCVAGACTIGDAPKGMPCDDKDMCSKGSACAAGACMPTDPTPCDDGNPCTTDFCMGKVAIGCTNETKGKECDDGNVCTMETCDPTAGCKFAPSAGNYCDDLNPCTENDACFAKQCLSSTPKVCLSTALCADSACLPNTGACADTPKADGQACNWPVTSICLKNKCIKAWATAIAVGPKHACATLASAGVACWGSNSDLAVGDVGLPDQLTPTEKPAIGPVSALAAGDGFTCVGTPEGQVKCWGKNDHGQLGAAGPSTAKPVVTKVEAAPLQIAAGTAHVCVRTAGAIAKVVCWGAGTDGQLGQSGVITDQTVAVSVSGVDGATWLAAGGGNTCAIVGGVPYCWGATALAWADPKANAKKGVPAPVKGVTDLKAVAVGPNHACGLKIAGDKFLCWGDNSHGELCADADTNGFEVIANSPFSATGIAVGATHTCFVNIGTAVCCGSFAQGQKGQFAKAGIEPVTAKVQADVTQVALGGEASCALYMDGSIECWGAGQDGKPIPVFTVPASLPQPVP